MTTEIAVVEATALTSHRAATNAAGLCRDLVVKTAMKIQGRRYVQVEGWQAIANAFGCVASARNVERVDGGFRATGQVIRVSDGTVISEAEGFVGDDEKTWANRPVFARRAMAQTRAMSRACRSAFAFVVTLMDAGLETTPAEEMSGVVEAEPVVVRPAGQPSRAAKGRTVGGFTQPQDSAAGKAKVAISKCPDIEAAEKLRALIDERHADGTFSEADKAELVALLRGRVEMLIGTEHEVTA